VVAALAFHLANFAFRSIAWRNVLRAAYPDRRVPLLGIAGAYAAGVAVNSFAPARGGDLAKIALARTQIRGSSVPTIVTSMGVVTLFDAVLGALVVCALLGFGLLPALPGLPDIPAVPALVVQHPAVAVPALALAVVASLLVARRFHDRLWTLWSNVRSGASILRTPRRYASDVVPYQLSAWVSRIGAAYFLLAAFGLPATVSTAAIVVMAGGLATLVPTPGGVGTQQVLLVYLLHQTASAVDVASFSIGMQAGMTLLNAMIGVTAAMVMFRTLRPTAAVRGRVQALRGERDAAS